MLKILQHELLLGKQIESVMLYETGFVKNTKNHHYSISLINSEKEYHNNHVYFISLFTNSNHEVNKVHVSLSSIVDEDFYKSFVNVYGEPSSILVEEKEASTKQKTGFKKDTVTVTKTFTKTRQGNFSDQPRFIIWKKENYTIEILMKYEQNKSEISFNML